jgi:phosphodiesterase/alkaline phosphatase D-like protein
VFSSTLVTAHSQTVSGLQASTVYHYRIRSADAANNLAISGDNTFTTSAAPDTTPPVITGIASGSITSSGATISWTTNEASDTQVQYGTTTAYGSSSAINSTKVTSHSQALSGLQSATLYHYRVLSRDAAGNLATSGDNSFTTLTPPDTTPPVISGITASNLTSTGAVVTWSTNEAATSQVEYGTTTSYGSSSTLNSTFVTGHSVTLGGLAASTTYHYRIKSSDAAGNPATSGDNAFTTSAAQDTTAPVISNIASGNILYNSANITWTTNEASSSQVEYGTTTAYGSSTAVSSTLVTSHSLPLTGLTASTVYHYRVKSADAAGNPATSADKSFTTSAAPDTTPPVISGISSTSITATSAVAGWTTNEGATSQVEYGTTTAYGSATTVNATLGTTHTQSLSGLQSGMLYHYRIKSADAAGNLAISGDNLFTTASSGDTTPPANVENFTATARGSMVLLNWINPPDSDFIGVRIRYRLDQFPSDITDGTLLGDFTGQPSEAMNSIQTSVHPGTTYYYSASTYDNSGNYQHTAYASVTVPLISDSSADAGGTSISGGCGMIDPKNGKPQGPGDAADMVSFLAVVMIAILKRELLRKKSFDRVTQASDIMVRFIDYILNREENSYQEL